MQNSKTRTIEPRAIARIVVPDNHRSSPVVLAVPTGCVASSAPSSRPSPETMNRGSPAVVAPFGVQPPAQDDANLEQPAEDNVPGYCPPAASMVAYPIDTDGVTEGFLRDGIVALWKAHQDGQSSLSEVRRDFKAHRDELARQLSAFKHRFCGVGREGEWGSFLRSWKIPRSTADRYVKRYRDGLPGAEKLLSEQLPEPTPDQINALAKKLKPKIAAVMTTRESVSMFISALTGLLQSPVESPHNASAK